MSNIIQNIASNQFLVVKNPLQPRQELYISAADLNNDILSQDIVDALEAANDPSSTNPYATIADITGEDYTELDPVLSRSTQAAAVQTTGNRYIASANGATWIVNNIYEWDGAAWIETVPVTDDIVDVIADGFYRRYTGTAWVQFGGVALLQGGNASSSVTFGSRSGGGVAYIRASNVNRVRVTNTQNNFTQSVYIGSLTATANAKLHVTASSNSSSVALFNPNTGNASILFEYDSGFPYISMWDTSAVKRVNFSANDASYFNGGSLGIGTNVPDSSALLDVTSTTKGVLIPRVTQVQRDAFAAVKDGLLVFNSTDGEFNYNLNSSWRQLVSSAPYKSYVALLTQSGTNAPIASVLENSIGGTPVWSRNVAGDYRLTITGAFTTGKTQVFIGQVSTDIVYGQKNPSNNDEILIGTSAGDDIIDNNSIEIRVYE